MIRGEDRPCPKIPWRHRSCKLTSPSRSDGCKIDSFRTTLALHNTIVILLNRPFLQRQCLDAVEGVACFQAALDTANLMQLYDSTHGMQNSPVTNSQVGRFVY